MNNDKKKLNVVDWQDVPPLIVAGAGSPSRYLPPAPIGVIGSLLIHVLIVTSAYFGSYGTKVQPPPLQVPGAFTKATADADESLVLITLPTMANSNQEPAQSIASLLDLPKSLANSPIRLDPPTPLNIEILALGEERPSQALAATGDGAEQARLYGMYTGQIRARIERIWRRPRTPVNDRSSESPTNADESFQCEAQIVQDTKGNVEEILLPRCNGSAAWQRSLVLAIQQASPLPAPPSPSVFGRSIMLNFIGLAYVPGSQEDDYEIPRDLARVQAGVVR